MVVMNSFGKRLRQLRKEKNLSQDDLAKLFHLSQSTIAYYESGRKQPTQKTLQKLAQFFTVSMDWLTGHSDLRKPLNSTELEGPYPIGKTVRIPVLGTIHAGEPLYAEQNLVGYEEVSADELNGGEYFFLKVTGDSMIGSHIIPGSKVLVRRQPVVDNGQIAVVMVNDEEATLKRIKFMEEAVILYPDNPNYEPQIHKADKVRIIGVVKRVVFDL
ncbi:MAG: helix-turn-helix domain-containing protein [Firmicutes bacterium]|nr:helix-turn-helix domain-containing protein [Bacillota bacterium]